MSKRIIFVDDESMVLAGLQRSLRSMREEWDMAFVTSGVEALQRMQQQPFDIIVTDMRMPVMTGAELLERVKLQFPQCFRIILSGQADQQSILRAVDPTHQYLAKPCDTNELKKRLTRAFAVRSLLKNEELQAVVSRLQALPSLPTLFLEVTHELGKPDPSLPKIVSLVSDDMAMTAKILQLVNSAFFGLRSRISSPMQAVQMLGLDTLRALVLTTHIFEKFRTHTLDEADISYLWRHSMAVANFAKHIAESEKADRQLIDDCFTAGLLHDAGKLILASSMETKYHHVLEVVRKGGQKLIPAETEILGCSHSEIAAYLLGLWGLPEAVIDGVAWHHAPSGSIQTGFSTTLAAHVATVFHEQLSPFWMQDGLSLDVEYLHKNGIAGRQEIWHKLLHDLASRSDLA